MKNTSSRRVLSYGQNDTTYFRKRRFEDYVSTVDCLSWGQRDFNYGGLSVSILRFFIMLPFTQLLFNILNFKKSMDLISIKKKVVMYLYTNNKQLENIMDKRAHLP